MLRALSSLFRGYVIIRARGGPLETLINRAVAQGIALWQLERAAPQLLVARVPARDFSRLVRTARQLGVDVAIVAKAGLPFLLIRAGRRHAFVAGAALFAGLLYVLSQFVWFVRVDGAEAVSERDILAAVAEAGLRPGVRRDGIRRDVVERRLYLALPRLAWASVELRGAVATVRVAERAVLDEDLRRPGHIVAVRDGVVERVAAIRGEVLVAPGETVRAGQPLISGMLAPGSAEYLERVQRGELPYVRAEGVVRGRAWYRGLGEAHLVHVLEEETGRVHRYLTIKVGEREWRIGRSETTFSAVRWEERTIAPTWLPHVSWTWHVGYEVRRLSQAVDPAAAREAAVASAREQAVSQLPAGADVVDEQISVWEDAAAGVIRAAVTVEVRQDLGRFAPIGDPALEDAK